ncbi:MAG: class I SAM-dependent methyltransferase [Bacteroidetes bacterium]|nr:class I SAM-dependent methyltransferase [Bacteroidota bacterium]
MSIGKVMRQVLGKNFHYVGELYRKIFVDLNKVLSGIEFSSDKNDSFKLLDIGGGDGAFINLVMDKYPNAKVDLIDIADNIGSFLKPAHLSRVRIFNKTSIATYAKDSSPNSLDCILIMDVLHHVGRNHRHVFFEELKMLVNSNRSLKIIVKDVEPGYFITWLSYLSDVYVSGDKQVWLISRAKVIEYFEYYFPGIQHYETNVFFQNKPNYSIVFHF